MYPLDKGEPLREIYAQRCAMQTAKTVRGRELLHQAIPAS
jgi:hypothetical protein